MSHSHSSKDFRVAIVGGGVCGLVCAIALAREGVPVDVFEATPKFKEIGAGLGLGPNAIRVLRDLGVWEDVFATSGEADLNMHAFRYISGMDDHQLLYDYTLRKEDRGLGIARYAFLDALVGHFDMSHAHFNKRCVDIHTSRTNPLLQTIVFQDGTVHEAHVIIGADGIKSTVRGIIVGQTAEDNITFSNTVAYRGLVPLNEIKDAGIETDLTAGFWCFIGRDKHIVTYPIRGGQVINVVAFVTHGIVPMGQAKLPSGEPWVSQVSPAELVNEYKGWGRQTLALLNQVHNPSKWSMCVVYPHLSSYVKGRVALVGDAAHAMLTHLGAGAGQGLEDAVFLARLLGSPKTHSGNLEGVLRIYDEIRRPRANMVWEESRRVGEIYEARGPHGYTTVGIQTDLTGIFDPIWHHDLDSDIQHALERIAQMD